MKRIRFITALVFVAVIIIGTAYAAQGNATIPVTYSNIKVYVDGNLLSPKDSAGNAVEPFAYNGTIYLPARAIGEALGKKVEWKAETSSALIYDPPKESVTLTAGFYTAGTDIPVGKYDCHLNGGSGNFIIKSDTGKLLVNEIFGSDKDYHIALFRNLTIKDGYEIEVRNGLSVEFLKA